MNYLSKTLDLPLRAFSWLLEFAKLCPEAIRKALRDAK
jgi:hypothetical protein